MVLKVVLILFLIVPGRISSFISVCKVRVFESVDVLCVVCE